VPVGVYSITSTDESITVDSTNPYIIDLSVSASGSNPSGYLAYVNTDDTLTGIGTTSSPLKVANVGVQSITAGDNIMITSTDGHNLTISATSASSSGGGGPALWSLEEDALVPNAGEYVSISKLDVLGQLTMSAPGPGTTTILQICDDYTQLSTPLDNTLPTAECLKDYVANQVSTAGFWIDPEHHPGQVYLKAGYNTVNIVDNSLNMSVVGGGYTTINTIGTIREHLAADVGCLPKATAITSYVSDVLSDYATQEDVESIVFWQRIDDTSNIETVDTIDTVYAPNFTAQTNTEWYESY
jgi:hypothetical protein